MTDHTARPTLSIAIAALLTAPAFAAIPAMYYDAVQLIDQDAMRSTLHDAIDDHTRFKYTEADSTTDVWDIIEAADEDPLDSSRVLDIYRNASYPKHNEGNDDYDREHSWPKSHGFPKDVVANYPYTDCHHLFVADGGYNSTRKNKPYRYASGFASEKPTLDYYGQGGGVGVYPGNSNWSIGNDETGTWETWHARRGDVARALLYMDVRYEGGTHGITGADEPDLILTDDDSLIVSNTKTNRNVAHMGMLSVLLEWHRQDPVDELERHRNDVVASHQGNRNPFIDYPEWVDCVFEGNCGLPWINEFHYDDAGTDSNEFVEIGGIDGTSLDGWRVIAYNGSGGGSYKTINLSGTIVGTEGCMGVLDFGASGLQNGPDGLALVDPSDYVVQFISYEGSFVATDGPASGMLSADIMVSETASTPDGRSLQLMGVASGYGSFEWDTPLTHSRGLVNALQAFEGACDPPSSGGDPVEPWINELHYDNASGDTNEGVEIAGPAGTDLSGWSIVAYNGSGGGVYDTENLSGTITDQGNGSGTIWFPITGLQNGPDGIALVDDQGTVIQFISYEGDFAATNGPAMGMMSTDIGVSETTSTAEGESLQVAGSGCEAADFSWQSPATATAGSPNGSQTFVGGCSGGGMTFNDPWINEFHYDNASGDVNEGVEIAGPAGLDLSGWSILAYNGSGGVIYDTENLSGIIPDEANGTGALWFPITGLQNGPDGLALVDDQGTVVQFLSYEGIVSATEGPAMGMMSTNVGVSESSSTQSNESLQLMGTGCAYIDFTWLSAAASTHGSVNGSQTFSAGCN